MSTETQKPFVDPEFEPQRVIHWRMWKAENPADTEENFNRNIWKYFRANLVEDRTTSKSKIKQRRIKP